MSLRPTHHVLNQAQKKDIPFGLLNELFQFNISGETKNRPHDPCTKCGAVKLSLKTVATWNKREYATTLVYCPQCEKAMTIYQSADAGQTPIRKDQAITFYKTTCTKCSQQFHVTATTWSALMRQTTHLCSDGNFTDLLNPQDRPKALKK
jgi:hypothetical protein